jgi:hypothetical protein
VLVFKRSEGEVIPITIASTGRTVYLRILKITRGGRTPKVVFGLVDGSGELLIETVGHSFNPDKNNPSDQT